jgi:DNA-binding SARP family transcriptional activator
MDRGAQRRGGIRVLGTTEATVAEERLPLRPREAGVLAALAFTRRPTSAAQVAELVWSVPPATATKSVHNHIARLRRLEPDLVLTTGDGYRIGPGFEVDRDGFEQVVLGHEGSAAVDPLREALGWWRGEAFGELADLPDVLAERARLNEMRRTAEEALLAARLLDGSARDTTADAEHLVRAEPYRERRWWLWMLALHRSGRRRDALATFQEARQVLIDGAGLEPGEELRALEAAVLADDPTLLTPAPLVSGSSPVSVAPPPPATCFVGRAATLTALCDHLLDGRERPAGRDSSDDPGGVLVIGEAGIGKSSLAAALTDALGAARVQVWSTRGEVTPTGPLRPVSRILEQLVDRHGAAAVATWAGDDTATLRRVTARLPDRTGGDGTTTPLGVAVGRVLERAAAGGAGHAGVLVADDAHLLAPTSARVLADAHLASRSVQLVLLSRTRQLPPALAGLALHEVVLHGLDRDGVQDYVTEAAGAAVTGEVAEHLRARSGGNPLLLGELIGTADMVRRLREGTTAAEIDQVEVLSSTVADLAQQRLADLSQRAATVVRTASLLGPEVDVELLEDVVGPAAGPLAEIVEAGLLITGPGPGELRFRHHAIQDAVAATTGSAARSEIHHAVGTALIERAAPWDRVAHHLLAAAGLDPDAALDACRRAAAEASEQFAHREAAGHHAAALDLLRRRAMRSPPEELDAAISQGEALHLAGDPGATAVLLEAADAAETVGDVDRMGRALLCICRLGPASDAGDPSPELAERIDRVLAAGPRPDVLAELAGAASLLHSMGADPNRCRELFELAETTARRHAPEVLDRVLPFAFLGLAHPDQLDRRAEVAEELVVLGRAGSPEALFSGLHQRFSVQVQRGDPGLRDSHAEMVALTERMPDPGHRWTVAYDASVVRYLDGDVDGAEEAAALALAVEGVAPSRRMSVYGVQLLALRRAQGRLPELAADVDRLVTEQPAVAGWRVASAAIAAHAGELDRAGQELDRLAARDHAGLPDDYTRSAAILLLVEAATLTGDPGRIARSLPLLEPLAGRLTWAGAATLGPVDLVLGRARAALGDHGGAGDALVAARRLGDRLDAPGFVAEAERALDHLAR